jgi:hypothetical protein
MSSELVFFLYTVFVESSSTTCYVIYSASIGVDISTI